MPRAVAMTIDETRALNEVLESEILKKGFTVDAPLLFEYQDARKVAKGIEKSAPEDMNGAQYLQELEKNRRRLLRKDAKFKVPEG